MLRMCVMGEAIDIGELSHQVRLADGAFLLGLDDAFQQAYLAVSDKPGDWQATPENFAALVKEIVDQAKVKRLNVDALREQLPAVMEGKPCLIARGLEPLHGKNGYVKYHFETNPAERIWACEEGEKIDFKQRHEINNVHEGDLLAELFPPTPYKDGVNVMGEKLSAHRGRKARIRPGKNVDLSEDKTKAFSRIEGSAKLVRGRIAVDNVKLIDGNIDFHTGNIEFNGDVVVTGEVQEGFEVKAGGSIHIAGTVDRASLKADGNITIDNGVYGKEGITIRAEGSISCGFAENARLIAGESLYAEGALINCDTRVGDMLHLKAPGKALIGGTVYAAHGVEAFSLGNPRLPAKTIVEFGGTNQALNARLRELKESLDKLAPKAKEGDKEAAAKLMEIQEELTDVAEEIMALRRAKVTVINVTYPGVVLKSDKITYEARHEISSMVYYRVKGKNEIMMRAYVSPRGRRATRRRA